MFSKRFNYNTEENKLSALLKDKKSAGISVLDLMESNPTNAGFDFDEAGILNAVSKSESLKYLPHPKGLKTARKAVAQYYKEKNIEINIDNIFLTSGTSEAYSFIFKLLTDPGDEILIPNPGYPLFSFIAEMESVNIKNYKLKYSDGNFWSIDFESLKSGIADKTKAVIIVNPNNPAGNYIKAKEINELLRICREHKIAVICDEVFLDYPVESDRKNIFSVAGINYVLTFTLSGLSKICGLPQMKLSWIIVGGPKKECNEAKEKLEIITDTYLSVGAPVQLAVGSLLVNRDFIQAQIKDRILRNYEFLKSELIANEFADLMKTDGGWYAVLKIKIKISEENMAFEMLDKKDVYIHPGFFFDFKDEGYIVVSLLTPAENFNTGIKRILEYLNNFK